MELFEFSLLDMTPYDRQSWFNLVGGYNRALWPFSLLALLFSIAMPLLLFAYNALKIRRNSALRMALLLLGLSWLCCGAVFHWQHFANLNWAAPWFGWVFIVQGALLVLAGLLLEQRTHHASGLTRRVLAGFVLLAGLVIYPLSGLLEGRDFGQLEWFPLLPASITLVTFAVLMLLNTRWRHLLVVIPLLWAVISGAFATTLGLLEFYFMAGAGIAWLMHFFLSAEDKEGVELARS